MRESKIEDYLVQQWEKVTKGICLKFPPLFYAGFPDRICLAYPGLIVFVETKATGGVPRKLQAKRHDMLRRFGFRVEVINSKEAVDGFILTL